MLYVTVNPKNDDAYGKYEWIYNIYLQESYLIVRHAYPPQACKRTLSDYIFLLFEN